VDKYLYMSLLRIGTPHRIYRELKSNYDLDFRLADLDRKYYARRATAIAQKKKKAQLNKPKKPPVFVFTFRFFTRLELMPCIDIEVNDSRSKIRRECYGFRDEISAERIYLKIDNDSIVMFRDSVAGFIIGKRYYIRNLELMKAPRTWAKVFRLLRKTLNRQGVKIDFKARKAYYLRHHLRWRTADLLYARRILYLQRKVLRTLSIQYVDLKKRMLSEKTWR